MHSHRRAKDKARGSARGLVSQTQTPSPRVAPAQRHLQPHAPPPGSAPWPSAQPQHSCTHTAMRTQRVKPQSADPQPQTHSIKIPDTYPCSSQSQTHRKAYRHTRAHTHTCMLSKTTCSRWRDSPSAPSLLWWAEKEPTSLPAQGHRASPSPAPHTHHHSLAAGLAQDVPCPLPCLTGC